MMTDDLIAQLKIQPNYYAGLAARQIEQLRAENARLKETQGLLVAALEETLAVACRNESGDYVRDVRRVLARAAMGESNE